MDESAMRQKHIFSLVVSCIAVPLQQGSAFVLKPKIADRSPGTIDSIHPSSSSLLYANNDAAGSTSADDQRFGSSKNKGPVTLPPKVQSSVLAPTESSATPEWHDSFIRNGFADFVPPMSDINELQCLFLGEEHDPRYGQQDKNAGKETKSLSWKVEDIATSDSIDSGGLLGKPVKDGDTAETSSDERDQVTAIESPEEFKNQLQALLFQHPSHQESEPAASLTKQQRPAYDCIFDRGLMDGILGTMEDSSSTGTVADVLYQASQALKEHGIYVMATRANSNATSSNTDTIEDSIHRDGALSPANKAYLERVGSLLGLQWSFEMDGISNDFVSVSVARRYPTDVLPPSFGKCSGDLRSTDSSSSDRLLRP